MNRATVPETIQEAQATLDAYNARWEDRDVKPYILTRVSRLHPTVHVTLEDSRLTVCGVILYKLQRGDPAEGKRVCDRCTRQLQRRFS